MKKFKDYATICFWALIISIFFYFVIKFLPERQKSQEEVCIEQNGLPVFKNETRYRGFPPGSWEAKVFYKCE